jgi:prevent-host-death family protein
MAPFYEIDSWRYTLTRRFCEVWNTFTCKNSIGKDEGNTMPLQYRTMTELKEKTASVIRAAQRIDVVITVRGEPKVMLQRISKLEVEGLQLLESPKVRRLLNRAIRDVKAGRTIPFEQLLASTAAKRS